MVGYMENNGDILVNRIVEIAEEHGFSVEYSINKQEIEFTFSKHTDFGQDFSFSSFMKDYDIYTLIESINEYYEGYDPDEETMLWVGSDGHGKNGAPYRLTDIVKDMEQCEGLIAELLNAMIRANNKENLWELLNN